MSEATTRAEAHATAIERLMQRIDAHESEAVGIDAEMKSLNVTPAHLKKIRAARKTLQALLTEGIIEEGDARIVGVAEAGK